MSEQVARQTERVALSREAGALRSPLTADVLRAALDFAGKTFEHIEAESNDGDVVVIAANAARAIRALLEPTT